ncbi:MAG TPA: hypothetical protein VGQ58_01805 [Candidatus Limnocylindrales bacterium]|jgi:hypothetical protein|nr:hypothetical protein [Candidatus Limnocylindrales bacterium]
MTTLVLAIGFAWQVIATWNSEWARLYAGGDLGGYLEGARRFLETGSPYLAEQVTGRWTLEPHSFVHPPAALALFVPFLVLPAVLWWAIPLGITGWAIARLRPARRTWPLLVLCLIWPRSIGSVLAGNSDIWVMAIVAAGLVLHWPFALLIIKPTFVPLSLLGFGRRSWFVAHLAVAAAMVATWALWVEYLAVVRNSQLRLDYSLLNLPLVVLPVIAWLGRARPQEPAAREGAATASPQ